MMLLYNDLLHLKTISLTSPFFFFFNDTATTEIYTLSLHDALPISERHKRRIATAPLLTTRRLHERCRGITTEATMLAGNWRRSEEHTSELQSQSNLVCRLLLEKKKKKILKKIEYKVTQILVRDTRY